MVVLDVRKSSKGLRVHDLFSLELLPQARAAKEEVRNAHFLSFLVFGLQICLSELSFAGVNFRHGGYNHEQNQPTGPAMCFTC